MYDGLMENTDAIGYTASAIASIILLPQVVKVIRTRRAQDVSYGMIFLIMTSSALWQVHGWMRDDIPLRISSGINLGINTSLGLIKFLLDRQQHGQNIEGL